MTDPTQQHAAPDWQSSDQQNVLVQDPYRMSRRSTIALVAVFLLIALGALSSMVGLPYAIMKPGPITNTLGQLAGKQLITVSGAQTYPTQGALDFTTVRISGGPGYRVTVWDLLAAAIKPSEDVVDEDLYFPKGVTDKQVEEESTAEMIDSQQEAIAVALKAVGQKVVEHVVIGQVAKDAPSAALLKAGDEIVTVDGKTVADSNAVRASVSTHKPGESVALGLVRDGKPLTVTAKTRDAQGRATVGVFLGVRFEFPIDVKINAGDVGGPSAGTMFSLAVYDTLTPGPLTGGQQIAGTGTIDSTGKVGPIGGIQQKLVGAHDGGAKWFLAPAENCDEVVGHVPDGLRVVRIATFDEAKTAVEAIADKRADSLPTCTK
ncbi:YlbL family protein [Pedococcus bigeumensis]|nr:PDZ domain-containing protein [Pedococcus bigeumensis]